MNITLAMAKCAKCEHEFSCPQLGDFGYGQFLFHGECGSVHALFQAIGSPAWDAIEAMVAPEKELKAALARGAKIQAACAHFADPIENQRLKKCMVCPHCFSTQMAWWSGDEVGVQEVPFVSFTQFMALAEPERLRLVESFFQAQQSIQPDGPASGGSAS